MPYLVSKDEFQDTILCFVPKFALGFYISGLENAIDLKFWPVVGNQIFLVTSHFCLTNKPSGTNFSQIYQANQHIYHFSQIYILVYARRVNPVLNW